MISGRADLHAVADRPIGLLRAESTRSEARTDTVEGATRYRDVWADPACIPGKLQGLRCAQGVAPTGTGRHSHRAVYSRTIDANPRITGRPTWKMVPDNDCRYGRE
jgi:hypothetical protein